MDVTPWVLHQGWGPACGRWVQARVPGEAATGYGPRCSALRGGQSSGPPAPGGGWSRLCVARSWPGPISLGTIHTVRDRVAQALAPHSTALATQARHAAVHSMDATSGFCGSTRQGLWVRARDTAAFSMRHPQRSTAAFAARMEDGQGLLVSDGEGISQRWGKGGKPAAPLASAPRGAWRPCPGSLGDVGARGTAAAVPSGARAPARGSVTGLGRAVVHVDGPGS